MPEPVAPVTRTTPRVVVRQVEHALRQVEALERRHLGRDQAHDHADRAALLEQVDAVAHPIRGAVGEVDVEVGLEVLALAVVHHVDRELRDRLAGQRRNVAHRPQIALDPEDRREPGLEVDVGRAELASRRQHPIEDLTHRQALG